MTTTLDYEPHAICHRTDAAIRAKVAKSPSAEDTTVLHVHGLEGDELNGEIQRLAGVDHSLSVTGTAEEFAQAEARAEKAKDALAKGTEAIQPKLDKARAEVQRLESQLRDLRDEERSAHDDLTRRQARRRMLQSKLLPPLIQQLVAVEEQPVRARFAPLIADARRAVSMATTRAASGMGRGERCRRARAGGRRIEVAGAAVGRRTADCRH